MGRLGALQPAEIDRFLAEPHLARLACLDDGSWPYVVPCWHEWDGSRFWVVPRKKSVWARYLRERPRCAITVDEVGGLRRLIAQCVASIVEEPNVGGAWVKMAERMATRYLGADGPTYLVPTLDRPRWLISLDPRRVWTWQSSEWADRYKN